MDVNGSRGCQRLSRMSTDIVDVNGFYGRSLTAVMIVNGSFGLPKALEASQRRFLEFNGFYGFTTALVAFQQLFSLHNGF